MVVDVISIRRRITYGGQRWFFSEVYLENLWILDLAYCFCSTLPVFSVEVLYFVSFLFCLVCGTLDWCSVHQSSSIGISNFVIYPCGCFAFVSLFPAVSRTWWYLWWYPAAAQIVPVVLCDPQCELDFLVGLYACACVHLCIEAFCWSLGSLVYFALLFAY